MSAAIRAAFDGEGPGAAHGVQESGALGGQVRPAGAQQDGGRQVLLERCGGAFLPVAAAVQRGPGEVQGQGRHLPMDIAVDQQVRVLRVHVGPAAQTAGEAVGNGVLDLESGVLTVAGPGQVAVEAHRKGARQVQVVLPRRSPAPRRRGRRGQWRGAGPGATGYDWPPGSTDKLDSRLRGSPRSAPRPGLHGTPHPEPVQLLGQKAAHMLGGGGEKGVAGHGGRVAAGMGMEAGSDLRADACKRKVGGLVARSGRGAGDRLIGVRQPVCRLRAAWAPGWRLPTAGREG